MASHIDRILDDVRRSVELTGKSGEKTVYKENVVFTLPCEDFEVPDDLLRELDEVEDETAAADIERCKQEQHPLPQARSKPNALGVWRLAGREELGRSAVSHGHRSRPHVHPACVTNRKETSSSTQEPLRSRIPSA